MENKISFQLNILFVLVYKKKLLLLSSVKLIFWGFYFVTYFEINFVEINTRKLTDNSSGQAFYKQYISFYHPNKVVSTQDISNVDTSHTFLRNC